MNLLDLDFAASLTITISTSIYKKNMLILKNINCAVVTKDKSTVQFKHSTVHYGLLQYAQFRTFRQLFSTVQCLQCKRKKK